MSERLLLAMEESWAFGMLWPRRLRIFEDRIEISSTELMRETTEKVEYGEISGVMIGDSGISASLLIKKRTGKPVLMRGMDGDVARQAKVLMEECINGAGSVQQSQKSSRSQSTEDLVRKLAELRDAGVLSPEEFEAKKKAVEERDH